MTKKNGWIAYRRNPSVFELILLTIFLLRISTDR